MDRGLQERLAGAAVLVALGVWLIPWVLDGSAVSEPEPEQTVALKLPAPDEAGGSLIRRQTIDLSAERGTSIKTQTAESGTENAAAAAAPEESTDSVDVAATQPQAERAAPAAREPVAGVSAQDATDSADDSAATPPQNAAASRPAPSSAALREIVAASPVAGWMVQLGSFSDAGNARRQAERIETFGHDARIYEFAAAGGRTMFRVRLGPLETRERAEATASSLAAHGFVAQLVAPE